MGTDQTILVVFSAGILLGYVLAIIVAPRDPANTQEEDEVENRHD